jgi:hypothetical protein
MNLRTLSVGVALGAVVCAHANIILNGDFESNTLTGTTYNLSNGTFTNVMSNMTGYGAGNELDVFTFGSPYGPDPQSGKWKVGLANLNAPDAFTFNLSSGIVAGRTYRLSFWAIRNQQFSTGDSPVLIGVSGAKNAFGTEVFSTTLVSSSNWQNFSGSFVAPVNGSFLSVTLAPNGGTSPTWMHVDNFSMEAVPEPGTMVAMAVGAAGILARRRRK